MHAAAMIHVSFVAYIKPNNAPTLTANAAEGRRKYANAASMAQKVKNTSSVS